MSFGAKRLSDMLVPFHGSPEHAEWAKRTNADTAEYMARQEEEVTRKKAAYDAVTASFRAEEEAAEREAFEAQNALMGAWFTEREAGAKEAAARAAAKVDAIRARAQAARDAV